VSQTPNISLTLSLIDPASLDSPLFPETNLKGGYLTLNFNIASRYNSVKAGICVTKAASFNFVLVWLFSEYVMHLGFSIDTGNVLLLFIFCSEKM
jgi:hypothetical protein